MTADPTPVVSGNGTSRERLLEERREIVRAARVLLEALGDGAPNGRDYIGETDRLQEAIDQNVRWQREVSGIIREITRQMIAIRG